MTTYLVDIDHRSLTYPCTCGDCDWSGDVTALDDIGDCSLTAGDPSPAGRCPECGTLAYPDETSDHVIDNAAALLAALTALVERVDNVTKGAGFGSGMFEPEMAAARSAIRKAA